MLHPGSTAKSLLKKTWFREGTVRRAVAGPYAGLSFEISPQLESRMNVFYSAYEQEVTDLLTLNVEPGWAVYVVGSHIGIHVLYIAKLLQGSGSIDAFEPWPENFLTLQKNIDHNDFGATRVTALNKAVGASDGVSNFTAGSSDGRHHLTQEGETATTQVEITTLDNHWIQTGQAPNLLLIDVEGEEMSVLHGGDKVITQCRPQLIIEHHGTKLRDQVTQWLQQRGYHVQLVGARQIYAK